MAGGGDILDLVQTVFLLIVGATLIYAVLLLRNEVRGARESMRALFTALDRLSRRVDDLNKRVDKLDGKP